MQHSPCADDFVIKREYLPFNYVKEPEAAGLHSSDMVEHKRNYIAEGHRSSVQDSLGFNPLYPSKSRHNLPIYEAEFYTGTQMGKGPVKNPVKYIPEYPHKKDEITVVIDDNTVKQGKKHLAEKLQENQQLLTEYDHPTRQTTDAPLKLGTEYYNPSIRSHKCFKMNNVNDMENYAAQRAGQSDYYADQNVAEQKRELIRNVEKLYDE